MDVMVARLGDHLPMTFQCVNQEGWWQRAPIDLVLANHSAMALVAGVEVLGLVRDGGHSPVAVDVDFSHNC